MSPWFFPVAGVVLGCVMAVPLTGGTVWVVQATMGRGFRAGLAAAWALALAQWVPAGGAALLVLMLARLPEVVFPVARMAATVWLLLLARTVLQAPEVASLAYDGPWRTAREVLRGTWSRAWRLRWRMAGYTAQFVAVSLNWRPHRWETAPLMAFGVVGGAFLWWFFFVVLAAMFGPHVPEPITLRSLNKLRRLGALTLTGLALIAAGGLFFG